MSASPPLRDPPYDPLYLHARREAVYILAVFLICMVWAVTVYYLDGLRPAGEGPAEMEIVFGMPRWAFWGVFVPWIFADVATIVFCFWIMADDDLGEAHEGEDLAEQTHPKSHDEQEDRHV